MSRTIFTWLFTTRKNSNTVCKHTLNSNYFHISKEFFFEIKNIKLCERDCYVNVYWYTKFLFLLTRSKEKETTDPFTKLQNKPTFHQPLWMIFLSNIFINKIRFFFETKYSTNRMEFVHKPKKNHSNLKNPDVVLWFIVETWCNCKSMKMFIKKS